jgi:hypothetical protein
MDDEQQEQTQEQEVPKPELPEEGVPFEVRFNLEWQRMKPGGRAPRAAGGARRGATRIPAALAPPANQVKLLRPT